MADVPAPPSAERRHYPRRWRRARRALVGLLVLIALGLLGNVALRNLGGPRLESLTPTQARVGETVTLTGKGFRPSLEGNIVYFGDTAGRLVTAARNRLEVEVPELDIGPQGHQQFPVRVQVGEEDSAALPLTVYPPVQPEPGTGIPEPDDEPPERPGPAS